MSNFFDETMQGLLEAVEIAKGNIPLAEREEMPAPTFYAENADTKEAGRVKSFFVCKFTFSLLATVFYAAFLRNFARMLLCFS